MDTRLDRGWTKHRTPDGKAYYHHKASGCTTWEEPDEFKTEPMRRRSPSAPMTVSVWKEYNTASGKVYEKSSEAREDTRLSLAMGIQLPRPSTASLHPEGVVVSAAEMHQASVHENDKNEATLPLLGAAATKSSMAPEGVEFTAASSQTLAQQAGPVEAAQGHRHLVDQSEEDCQRMGKQQPAPQPWPAVNVWGTVLMVVGLLVLLLQWLGAPLLSPLHASSVRLPSPPPQPPTPSAPSEIFEEIVLGGLSGGANDIGANDIASLSDAASWLSKPLIAEEAVVFSALYGPEPLKRQTTQASL